jgi:hypothetical protein
LGFDDAAATLSRDETPRRQAKETLSEEEESETVTVKWVNPKRVLLILEFVDVVRASHDALVGEDDDLRTTERIYRGCVAAAASDAKFRDAWKDPDFQDACWIALQSKGKDDVNRLNLRAKMRRYYIATISALWPEQKVFTESELEAIREECGLTDEEIERFESEEEIKFNKKFNN